VALDPQNLNETDGGVSEKRTEHPGRLRVRLCKPAEGFHEKWVVFSGFLGPLASFVVASLGHNCVPPPSFRGGIIGWPCLIKESRLAHANNPSMECVNEDCLVAKLCF
jgi:hypothetical protein